MEVVDSMNRELLSRRIAVAAKREPADVVIKNGKIVDVMNSEIYEADIAIADGYIVGIGNYDGLEYVDAEGQFIAPSFTDGHVHIESSMVTPAEFAKVLLTRGVTTAICDPHEIANVLGIDGIEYMLDSSENLPFDFYFMLPSCVPATDFEHSGAKLNSSTLLPLYEHPRVLGLAEVMNSHAVWMADQDMLDKIIDASKNGKKIDGHAAGLSPDFLNVYMSAGIRTDHECINAEEAKERLRRGMYLMIREGTVAKDLHQLISVVNDRNARRCLFVTDDKHLDDILLEGSIDHNVRLAVAAGISPITAIQMATLNAAECFGLHHKGAIAPGYQADIIFLKDLTAMAVTKVFKSGRLVAENGRLLQQMEKPLKIDSQRIIQTVQISDLNTSDLQLALSGNRANIIGIIPNNLVTKHIVEEVDVMEDGHFASSIAKDQLKLAVIERHHQSKHIGLGIVKGLGLKSGAIATTIAHDSHNLIIAGTNDRDMVAAAKVIKELEGGLVVVKEGKVLASLQLSIAGLMSTKTYKEVLLELENIHLALKELGANQHFNPFLTLSFLALPVIPELKLTDMGLFSSSRFRHIGVDEFED
jgi:adenine deaminase